MTETITSISAKLGYRFGRSSYLHQLANPYHPNSCRIVGIISSVRPGHSSFPLPTSAPALTLNASKPSSSLSFSLSASSRGLMSRFINRRRHEPYQATLRVDLLPASAILLANPKQQYQTQPSHAANTNQEICARVHL